MQQISIRQAGVWCDPLDVASAFADEPYLVLLHSGSRSWSYLLRTPTALMDPKASDPFAALAGLLVPTIRANEPPFQGGVVGLASYELAAHVEQLKLRRTSWPDLHAAVYDSLLAFDHVGRRILAVGRAKDKSGATARAILAESWIHDRRPAVPAGPLAQRFESALASDYEAVVAQVIRRIRDGEVFQANLARTWSGTLFPCVRPFDLFARLCRQSPAPFSAYLRLPGRPVVSNSPERFLRLDRGRVVTQPIKGTAPRSANPEEDVALAQALEASPKDRAENLMIVDLMRNDLARVCRPGSVAVGDMFSLRSFSNVHHLVSTVEGELTDDNGPADLLRAAFPPGSITGAPKVQAMKIIAELEEPRGPYCGSLFWANSDGLDPCVLIRTVLFDEGADGWAFETRAGAGIVADSDPSTERLETEAKMASITRALTRHG